VKAAFDEALIFMNEDTRGTAEIYNKWEPSKKSTEWLQKNMFKNP
jgi:hypothetical protein